MKSNDQNIIFASGPSRSGTTLLQLVLSSHKKIHITPETKFTKTLLILAKKDKNKKKLTKKNVEILAKSIKNDPFLSTWPYPIQGTLLEYIEKNKADISPSDVYSYLLNTPENESRGCSYIGNKQETFVDGYGLIAKKMFPSAKFIIIVRDPRDVTRSVIKSFSKKKKRGLLKSAATTFSANKYIEQLKSVYPEDVFVLRYEDLVIKPEETCKNICNYLKIEYDNNMINFYKQNKSGELLIGDTRNIHKNLTTPFNRNLAYQWKKNTFFSKLDLLAIESINKKYIKQYSYKQHTINISPRILVFRIFVYLRFQYKYIKYKFF